MIYSLAKKIKMFQEQWDQIIKEQEEELQQLRETYHNKIMIDSSDKELQVSQKQLTKD